MGKGKGFINTRENRDDDADEGEEIVVRRREADGRRRGFDEMGKLREKRKLKRRQKVRVVKKIKKKIKKQEA